MKKAIKITVSVFSFVLILTSLIIFSSAENVSGHLDFYYDSKHVVNNDWILDTESGLLTITSKTTDYNETGTGQSDHSGSWYKYKDQIKKVVLDGNFSKISNNAFNGYTNLREVVITDDVNQIDAYAFYGCKSLTAIYIGTVGKTEGMADLRNVPKISKYILSGTAIKTVYISSEVTDINSTGLPSGLAQIYGTRGTFAEIYANANGITFFDPSTDLSVKIYVDDFLYKTYWIEKGSYFQNTFFEYNGKIYTVFTDKACTEHYDNTRPAEKAMSLYAKPLLTFDGWSVRVRDYKGLRSIFEYDTVKLLGSIKVTEVGAIVAHSQYALDDFIMEEGRVTKVTVYENGKKVGRTLAPEENNKVSFAVTVVGFEGTEEEFIERSLKNTVFRGFMTFEDEKTGEVFNLYTDAVGTNLRTASQQYLKYAAGSSEEKSFVKEVITATESSCSEVRYDKKMLMSVLEDVYYDSEMLIVGEEISPNKTALDVQNSFKASSGEYPSIIGMDLACYGIPLMTCKDTYRTSFLKDLIDYCRAGGIITASSHFQNPTGNWGEKALCRGLLGEKEIWEELLTEGTALNNQFNKELEANADFLRELGNNGVPVLWRPFHEMNGSWFWWCITQDQYQVPAKNFHDLWIYVYDYYEKDLGLTNLIWVYSPNNDKGNLVDVDYCYPGDEYVDMTGLDWYSSGNYEIGSSVGAYHKMMAHGMPVAITEFGGSSGELDSIETWNYIQRMYDDGMRVAYIMTWTDKHSFQQAGKVDELMEKPDTLSRNEVYYLFKSKEPK